MNNRCILDRDPRSILVISFGGIGDILLMTPLIRSLKARYPDARIDVYVQQGRTGILEGNPDITEVFTSTRRHGWRSYLPFFLKFSMRYDLAVSTRTSDRETLFARAAGRRAISLVPPARPEDAWKRWALSGFHPHDEETHVVDELFRLLDVVGVPPVRDWRIPVSSNVTHRVTGRYAVMHLFPRNLYKSWTPEGWCRVGRHLSDRGLKIVILGGRGEEERSQISDVVGMMSGDVISLAGATTFAEIAELLGGCDVYVGPDTAMTHLAAAVGAPTVALVGPTNLRRYAPYDMHGDATGSRIRLVVGPCTCGRPEIGCAAHAALRGACMETIAPEAVVEAIDGILRRQFPPCVREAARPPVREVAGKALHR